MTMKILFFFLVFLFSLQLITVDESLRYIVLIEFCLLNPVCLVWFVFGSVHYVKGINGDSN